MDTRDLRKKLMEWVGALDAMEKFADPGGTGGPARRRRRGVNLGGRPIGSKNKPKTGTTAKRGRRKRAASTSEST
jgi:hypothetical protein